MLSKELTQKASKLRAVILDVDGVMTDGKITYSEHSGEIKSFNVRDGLGIKWLKSAGFKLAIITGRKSKMVEQRAKELAIDVLIQGRDDKKQAGEDIASSWELEASEIAYIGDDLPDLAAIEFFGFGVTVANAPSIIKDAADYTCYNTGGNGAVRELCELILEAQGNLKVIQQKYALSKIL